MPSLKQLLAGVAVEAIEPGSSAYLTVGAVRDDSRQVQPGDVFVAVRGQTVDGHAFVPQARARGAVVVVVEEDAPGGPFVRVPSAARALGELAANQHGRPGDALRLVGITGTNGKTTCSYLVEAMLAAAGRRAGVIGTVAYRTPAWTRPAPFTTPTPLVLHATLAEMRDVGCSDVVMECSSHALALERLAGLRYAAAGFTNLTHDHLDLHGTLERYADEKEKLFTRHLTSDAVAAVCVDGPFGERMVRATRARVLRVSAVGGAADIRVERVARRSDGMTLACATPAGAVELRTPLVGTFHVENLAVSLGLGLGLGLGLDVIATALASARGAPGRLERVSADGDVSGYVDYAHTPDALARALEALRPIAAGQLWVVFGCGGDRDRAKRPVMGRIAAEKADRVIVTSDNPRSESPGQIIAEILAGCPQAMAIEDRHLAIHEAVARASAGDVVLVAGKGHEDYQLVGDERRHFDDREVLSDALCRRAARRG